MDKVSIIIPCYNQAHFLADAITSALCQTYPEKEIIIVNDGSTDNTGAVVKYFDQRKNKNRPEIIYIEQENKGLSAARNAGVKHSSGNWIVCLDADDKLAPNYIEKTIGISDIVCTGTVEFGDRSRLWKSPLTNVYYEQLLVKNRLNYAAIYKKEVWNKVGGYDEQMKIGFEDWKMWLDAAKAGFKIRIISEFLFFYRKHGKSMFAQAQEKRAEIIDYMRNVHKNMPKS